MNHDLYHTAPWARSPDGPARRWRVRDDVVLVAVLVDEVPRTSTGTFPEKSLRERFVREQ